MMIEVSISELRLIVECLATRIGSRTTTRPNEELRVLYRRMDDKLFRAEKNEGKKNGE
jgi:hypothetical protein